MKALGVGLGAVRFDEVEVVRVGLERPVLVLHGSAAERAERSGITRWHLSLTHTDAMALAFVVAEAAVAADGRPTAPTTAPTAAPTTAPTGAPRRPDLLASGTMQPLLTVAEMRAVDAAAQATTALDVLVERAGTAVAVPGPRPCWAVPTDGGWWWWPARATTAPTAGWPAALLAAGGPG